jgi:hypothetical protein
MDDIGFILASYAVTLGAVALYAATMVRRARRAGRQIPPAERPWT